MEKLFRNPQSKFRNPKMKPHEQTFFVIDFDSTFTKVEGLDELAAIALQGNPNKDTVVSAIKALTDRGMAGEISFQDSLRTRIELLKARREHLPKLVEHLATKISESFKSRPKLNAGQR